MKWSTLGLCILFGCSYPKIDNVIKETYIHMYGVEISCEDWYDQGKEGKVVLLLKNGTTVTKSYRLGQLHGEVTYSFPYRKEVERVEEYKNNQRIKYSLWYPSGFLKEEVFYREDGKREEKQWYEQGSLKNREIVNQKKLEAGEYYGIHGETLATVKQGQGVRAILDNFGQLEAMEEFLEGQCREKTTYYPNGFPHEVIPYEQGEIHGRRRVFVPEGGVLNAIEEWVFGKQEGMTTLFSQGEKIAEVPYRAGKKEGMEKHYNSQGEIVQTISWSNGLMHGSFYTYVGGETSVDWYYKGKRVSQVTYEQLVSMENNKE